MSFRNLDRRSFSAAFAAAAVSSPALSRAQVVVDVHPKASRVPDDTYTPPTDLSTIADIYKRMTAAVTINGAGPFQFVVDTGANQSVIAADLALSLGLPVGDSQALNGVAGVSMTPTARASLQIGARPANQAVLSVLPASDIGAPGMLGLDQLDGGRLTLDFRHQRLTIGSRSYLPGAGEEVALKAHRRDGQLTLVDADLAGIHITAFLDSGAQATIGNMALRDLAITRYPKTTWIQTPILSVNGQTIDAQIADLPTLRIGSLRLPSWPMAFADLHTFRMWNLVDRPAILIGVDILSRFETVCLDFVLGEVRLRLPESA